MRRFLFLLTPLSLLLPLSAAAQPILRFDADAGVAPTAALTETNGGFLYTGPDGSQAGVTSDAADLVHDYDGQAGSSAHIRLSRGTCDPWASPLADGCDKANPWANNLTIAPYYYGYAFSYPGLIEMNLTALSVHNNLSECYGVFGCNGSGQIWIGDDTDAGGLYATAYTPRAGAPRGYIQIAADNWAHDSHGDLRLTVRDSADTVGVWTGTYGAETAVATIDGTGALTCSSVATSSTTIAPTAEPAAPAAGFTLYVDSDGALKAKAATGKVSVMATP